MRGKGFAAGLLAVAGILGWSGASRGQDTIRLNMVDQAPTKNLVDDGSGADTIRTWHRGFGGFGGYRGFGFGGYRGFGWGGYRGFGWGGYRGFGGLGYGGFYRPYYGFGLGYGRFGYGLGLGGLGYGRFGYGLGLGGLGYGLGFGGLGFGGLGGYGLGYGGFYPGFGIGYGGLWGPCAGANASVYTLNMPMANFGTPLPGAPAPQQAPADGTFPYDGGPSNPVPKAKDTPPTSNPPQRSVPLEGRSVSLPKAAPKWSFPAYGETARRTTPDSDRTYLTRGNATRRDAR